MFHTKNYRELNRLFFMFVIPAVSSQLLSGIYTIVDGYFVGWGIGQGGLAAIGLSFPFSVIVTAIGAGIGVGGGALIAISMGRGREALAQRILGAMVFLMIAASAVSSLLLTPLAEYLLTFYKVSPDIAEMARYYAWILIISSPAQVVTMAMLGAVRNDGFPRKAMAIMIAAFGTNIVLDWLWVIVFPFGIAGAAWATVASQAVSALLLSAHFLLGMSKVRLRPRFIRLWRPLARRIAVMGVSPFGVQIATAVTMILYNWQALAYGGDIGVAAYAVVGYIVPVGVMLEEGVAEGIQPLISYYHGGSGGACLFAAAFCQRQNCTGLFLDARRGRLGGGARSIPLRSRLSLSRSCEGRGLLLSGGRTQRHGFGADLRRPVYPAAALSLDAAAVPRA